MEMWEGDSASAAASSSLFADVKGRSLFEMWEVRSLFVTVLDKI
ncbi:MAG: hypothetical protein VKL60_02210 [Sphaerospermopsis sp.]|nr:hypothetical protein [Sphaerospermopsis sp.]